MRKDQLETAQHSGAALNGRQQTTLDLLRIAAAYCVLFGHSFSFFQCTVFKDQTRFLYLQNAGVVIFFLLSGFLTSFSLERKNRNHSYSFSRFFVHKAVRILKEYLPGLVFIAVLDAVSIAVNGERYAYYHAYTVRQFFGNVFMLQNMGPTTFFSRLFVPFGSGRPLWTLSVEWWLYMLFGALFLSVSKKEKISLPRILVFGAIVFMICGYLISGRGGGLGFVFALGVLSYYIFRQVSNPAAGIVFAGSCVLFTAYGLLAREAYTVFSFILLFLILTSALGMGNRASNTKRNAVLAFLSKSTFMLYLIHYSIIDFFARLDTAWSVTVRFALGIVCSLSLSLLGYYLFGERDLIGSVVTRLRQKSRPRSVRT